MNTPDGATACPNSLLPQHSTEPSERSPHECLKPADTWVNTPDGATASPNSLEPQHSTEPSERSPHECSPPADTCVNDVGRARVTTWPEDQATTLDFTGGPSDFTGTPSIDTTRINPTSTTNMDRANTSKERVITTQHIRAPRVPQGMGVPDVEAPTRLLRLR